MLTIFHILLSFSYNKWKSYDPIPKIFLLEVLYLCFLFWISCTHWYGRNKVSPQAMTRIVLDDKILLQLFFRCAYIKNKGGTIRDLLNPEEPPSTLYKNKHEQFTPKYRTWTFICLFSCTSNWRFSGLRIRAKAQNIYQ